MKSISNKIGKELFKGYFHRYYVANGTGTYFSFDPKSNIMRVTSHGLYVPGAIFRDYYFDCTYDEFRKYYRRFRKPF